MPILIEESKTPKGQKLMLVRSVGKVSLQDAEGMGTLIKPGQPYHGGLILNILADDLEHHPEARRYFYSMNGNFKRLAVVIRSTIVRAMVTFMMRIGGKNESMRLFSNEAEALAWLDE